MTRHIAPLNGLRAFEAAARHLSFTKAAAELSVTPAAVSQQVKALEAYTGVPLFERITRGLKLTDAGASALPSLQAGFSHLAEATRALAERRDDNVLTVSVPPTFGARWLVPRLDGFYAAHPEIEVRIDATDRNVDFRVDRVDIALRYGRGHYEGLASERLLDDLCVPVCSPSVRDGEPPLRAPDDLRHATLLHVEWKVMHGSASSWRMWLQAVGVEGVNAERGPRFSMEAMAMHAAMRGQGVALASLPVVSDELDAGRLVVPFMEVMNIDSTLGYHVVYPSAGALDAKTQAFRDWVVAEAARERSKETISARSG